MEVYIYAADLYCDDCGRSIRERLDREGLAPSDPDDETSYDSDEYPKGPFADGGGEADSPQHCGAGADCRNAIRLPDGSAVGAFLENPLTADGDAYVTRAGIDESDSPAVALWCQHYGVHRDTPDDRLNRAKFDALRMENGRLPAFAFPGGYPIVYLFADNGACCPACANQDNGSEASPTHDESMWRLVAFDVHYEGPPLACDHCGAEIGSAYGDPDAPATE